MMAQNWSTPTDDTSAKVPNPRRRNRSESSNSNVQPTIDNPDLLIAADTSSPIGASLERIRLQLLEQARQRQELAQTQEQTPVEVAVDDSLNTPVVPTSQTADVVPVVSGLQFAFGTAIGTGSIGTSGIGTGSIGADSINADGIGTSRFGNKSVAKRKTSRRKLEKPDDVEVGSASVTATAKPAQSISKPAEPISKTVPVSISAPVPVTASSANDHGSRSNQSSLMSMGANRLALFANLDDFIPGRENQRCLNAALAVVENPGRYSPLMFFGGSGLGKTHLLQGIHSGMIERKISSVYYTCEQFVSEFQEQLRANATQKFRNQIVSRRCFLLDNVEFLAGKQYTAMEFGNIVSLIGSSGNQIVLSSSITPEELDKALPQLHGMFRSSISFPVKPSEYEVRLEIVRQMCEKRKLNLTLDIRQMIASKVSGNIRYIAGALNRLELCARSTSLPGSFTSEWISDMLSDWTRDVNFMVSLSKIEQTVCQMFNVNSAELKSNSRARQYSYPRTLAMWLARKFTRKALAEIGDYFGNRSHSTVVAAQKRVEEWITESEQIDVNQSVSDIKTVIQTLEEQLRNCA